MSGPAFVVMPVNAGDSPAQEQHNRPDTEKMAAAIQKSVYEQTHPPPPKPKQENGPLKEILAHQDSLYRYISWEDPVRTLGSYVAGLSILTGAHYMPLTQWALKLGAYLFGAVAVAEYASRSFGPDTFLSRIRPKPYKKVPDQVLNATLKDIHDFVQYSVVQAQRILYGEDLSKTFLASFLCTSTYWLIKIASPFWLSVVGFTSLYVAPLVISPQAREVARAVAQDTAAMAGDAATATIDSSKRAVDSGKSLAHSGVAQVSEQSSKARDTVMDASSKARGTVMDASNRVGTSASNLVGMKRKESHEQEEKDFLEGETEYALNRTSSGDRAHSGSSIPRAVHKHEQGSHPEGRKSTDGVHAYKDPLENRVWPGRSA